MTDAPNIRAVSDPDDPALIPYLNQKDAWLKAPHNPLNRGNAGTLASPGGRFIAEGALVLHVLAASRFEIESVLVTQTTLGAALSALRTRATTTRVLVAPQGLVDRISGFHVHRGVLASGFRGETPQPLAVAAEAQLLVVLEDLSNHDNVGGIFRSIAALAGEGGAAWLTPRCCDPLYRKAIRVSMGHVLTVPWAHAPNWPGGGVGALRSLGFTIWSLATGPEADELDGDLKVPARLALVLGAEGPGLSPGTLELADRRVRIGMAPGVDSLNVGVACAVALHRWRATHVSRAKKDGRSSRRPG
ncbi:MAG: RNA methyltransferase [Phycisphaerales bacterium]|nr:RNA methyltransferase [Phycisphaerales bacterium]